MNRIGMIGGGVGAMVAALLLARKGYEITIFEKSYKLGGRLSFVERDGCRIDEGPTIVLLPDMIRGILAEAGVAKEELELVLCDPLYTIHYQDGTTYTKYTDMERQLQELARVFPGDVTGFQRFMQDMRVRFTTGKPAFLERSFLQKRDFFTYENVKTLIRLRAYQSTRKMMAHYFQDERLQDAYALQTLYIGGNPGDTPAIYSLVSFSEHEYGIWYVKGGYASLVELLRRKLEESGVRIMCNAAVTRVPIENGKAAGLEVNGAFHPFDAVLLNGDYPTMLPLFGEEAKKSYTPSSGCVLLYLGLDRLYEEAQVHQFFMGRSMEEHMKQVFQTKEVPADPSFYVFHPSLIDETLAPPGKSVMYTLVPVPSGEIDWSAHPEFIEQILDSMEQRGFPDLRRHIEWMQVKTPQEAQREGMFGGGSFGIAPILFQSGAFRPQAKPLPYENVYAAGASVHPGGGIPIVMQGAKLAAEAILQSRMRQKGEEPLDSIGVRLS
ncbi:phytoene desaturase family protein [Ectobacillus ponti]|uniref:Phytoene desaturase family protein n=1 Tax=Ectobacillus ponti TaxID=2961894 RepID=A0AA41X7U1_9BACI|nr:phytoene desaturase family protein [Ectobacillus ponti]MCP8968254.1 phytoene desaturase family protein [Ectobacillus ponti]